MSVDDSAGPFWKSNMLESVPIAWSVDNSQSKEATFCGFWSEEMFAAVKPALIASLGTVDEICFQSETMVGKRWR